MPIKQAGYRPEPRDETVNFSDRVGNGSGPKDSREEFRTFHNVQCVQGDI